MTLLSDTWLSSQIRLFTRVAAALFSAESVGRRMARGMVIPSHGHTRHHAQFPTTSMNICRQQQKNQYVLCRLVYDPQFVNPPSSINGPLDRELSATFLPRDVTAWEELV